MKALVMKMINIFRENVWLRVVGVIFVVAFVLLAWNLSLNKVGLLLADNSISALYDAEAQTEILVNSDDSKGNDNALHIKIEDGQSYLCTSQGETVFGPCRYIYNDISFYNKVFRFVDQNGLIGYAKLTKMEVSVLHEGKFTEASEMSEGSACVKEGDYYYYIDKEGKRFTYGKYVEAYPFAESQGCYARVKTKDGSWSIIDKEEDKVLEGFSSICELPCITTCGAGVKDGKVVLFSLEHWDGVQPRLTSILDDYMDVYMYHGDSDYVFVTDKQGNKGVIDKWTGEIVVPAEYNDIDSGYVENDRDENLEQRWFSCQKKDGTFDYVYIVEGEW